VAKEKPGDEVKIPPESLQLEYDSAFRDAGLTGLLEWPRPGISNIMARIAADRLDEVQEIEVRDGGQRYRRRVSVRVPLVCRYAESRRSCSPRSVPRQPVRPPHPLEARRSSSPSPVGLSRSTTWTMRRRTRSRNDRQGPHAMDFRSRSLRTWHTLSSCSRNSDSIARHPIEVEVKSTGEKVKVAPRDMLAALMRDPKSLAGSGEGRGVSRRHRARPQGRRQGGLDALADARIIRSASANTASTRRVTRWAPRWRWRRRLSPRRNRSEGVYPPEVLDPAPFSKYCPSSGSRSKRRPP